MLLTRRLVILFVGFLFFGCTKNEVVNNSLLTNLIENNIVISTGNLSPSFDVNTTSYNVTSLNCIAPFSITVKCDDRRAVTINKLQAKPNIPFSIKLDRLGWADYIPVTIDNYEYRINVVHSSYPRFTAFANNPSSGDIHLSGPIASIISNDGKLKYYDMNSGFFIKAKNQKGEPRYVAFQSENFPLLQGPGYNKNKVKILNQQFQLLDEVYPIAHDYPNDGINESHDFVFIDDGHYIFTQYTPKIVNNIPSTLPQNTYGTQVVAAQIQEIKDGQVIFEWFSTDYPQFYATSVEGNDYKNIQAQWADYMHLNSVVIDPMDNNLILSLRRQSSIIKINRISGEVIWVLSGTGDQFGLTSAQKTSFQHHATCRQNVDGTKTIMAYDNRTGSTKSRIVEYTINETTKSLVNFNEVVGPWYGSFNGSVQKQNNYYLVAWGGPRPTAAPTLSEFTSDQQMTLNIFFGTEIIYRALKYDF